jgi:hypothetical protein
VTGPSSVKRGMTRGSQAKFGCAEPVAHPSSDTLKSKVTRTPMTLPMNLTSKTEKAPICRKHFGVLVRFAFSGMNNADSALCVIQKSLGSRVGACTTAFPVGWVVRTAQKTVFYFIRSAMTGFTASAFLSRNRVSPKEAFEGLELCERKLSCTVLRGLDGSNPVRLLGHTSRICRLAGSGYRPSSAWTPCHAGTGNGVG